MQFWLYIFILPGIYKFYWMDFSTYKFFLVQTQNILDKFYLDEHKIFWINF